MIFLHLLCFSRAKQICIVGTEANKALCSGNFDKIITFDEIIDDDLSESVVFTIAGEEDVINQYPETDSEYPKVISMINQASNLAKNSGKEVPLLTFRSIDARQKVLITIQDDGLKICVNVAFHNINFINSGNKVSPITFDNLTLINCTYSNTGSGGTNLICENYLATDIISTYGWLAVHTSLSAKTALLLLDNDYYPTKVSGSSAIKVNIKASITIINVNIYESCTICENRDSFDIELLSTTGNMCTLSSISLLDDNSITINCGKVSDEPALIDFFEYSRNVDFSTFPSFIINTVSETTVHLSGALKSWVNFDQSKDQFKKSMLIVSNTAKVWIAAESFPFIIEHKSGNLTLYIETDVTLPNTFYESTTEESLLIFESKSTAKLTLSSGIMFMTANTQFSFKNPASFSLIAKTFDYSNIGSFSVYPLIFKMYRSNEGKIIFPSITLTGQEKPEMTSDMYVVIDPCVPMFPALKQSEVEAMKPDEKQTFLIVQQNSNFINSKFIFPPEQGQLGFWNGSSILSTEIVNTGSFYLKATIDPEKRATLPLVISLGKAKSYDAYVTENLPAELFNSLIPEEIKDINIIVQEDTETYIDFSGLEQEKKDSCVFSVKGNEKTTSQVELLNTENINNVAISNTLISLQDQFAANNADIINCLFTEETASKISFKEGSEINLTMSWSEFQDFGKKAKLVDIRNAQLLVYDVIKYLQISFSNSHSSFKTESGDEVTIAFNDPLHIPIFRTLNDADLKFSSASQVSMGVTNYAGVVFETSGIVEIDGNWNSKEFSKGIMFNNNDEIKFNIYTESLPYFTTANEDKAKYIISNSLIDKCSSSKKTIEFPSWFTNKVLYTDITLLNHSAVVTPESNKVVFKSLLVNGTEEVIVNNIEVSSDAVLKPGSSLTVKSNIEVSKTITMKWSLDDGFPSLKLNTSNTPKSINIECDAGDEVDIDIYNELFSHEIGDTRMNGSFIFSNEGREITTKFSFTNIPNALSKANISTMSYDGAVYVTGKRISDDEINSGDAPKSKGGYPIWVIAVISIICILVLVIIAVSCFIYNEKHQIGNDTQEDTKKTKDHENPDKKKTGRKKGNKEDSSDDSYTCTYSYSPKQKKQKHQEEEEKEEKKDDEDKENSMSSIKSSSDTISTSDVADYLSDDFYEIDRELRECVTKRTPKSKSSMEGKVENTAIPVIEKVNKSVSSINKSATHRTPERKKIIFNQNNKIAKTPSIKNKEPITIDEVKSENDNTKQTNKQETFSTPKVERTRKPINNQSIASAQATPKLVIKEPTAETPHRPFKGKGNMPQSQRSSRRRREDITDASQIISPRKRRVSKTPFTPRRRNIIEFSSDLSDSCDTVVVPTTPSK